MKAYTYLGQEKAALLDRPVPQLQGRVTPWCG